MRYRPTIRAHGRDRVRIIMPGEPIPTEPAENVADFYDPNDPIQKLVDREPPLRYPKRERIGRWYQGAEKEINGHIYKMVKGRFVEIVVE
jgi:hypothetical protein